MPLSHQSSRCSQGAGARSRIQRVRGAIFSAYFCRICKITYPLFHSDALLRGAAWHHLFNRARCSRFRAETEPSQLPTSILQKIVIYSRDVSAVAFLFTTACLQMLVSAFLVAPRSRYVKEVAAVQDYLHMFNPHIPQPYRLCHGFHSTPAAFSLALPTSASDSGTPIL